MKPEITPRIAARRLGCHVKTVYRWCRDAIDGEASPLRGAVRRTVTGRYFIQAAEVQTLLGSRVHVLPEPGTLLKAA